MQNPACPSGFVVTRRRLPFWVDTKTAKSERRTRLSRARRPMSITARHPADLAIAQAARGWPCPSLLHCLRTRTPHARARSHLVQVSRRWRQARWTVRAPQLVCEAQRVCQTNTRTQYMSLSARTEIVFFSDPGYIPGKKGGYTHFSHRMTTDTVLHMKVAMRTGLYKQVQNVVSVVHCMNT